MLNKSSLKLGDIVETREGKFYIYAYVNDYNSFYFVRNYGHRLSISKYTKNLLHSNINKWYRNFDIVNIYKPLTEDRISRINTNIYMFEYPFNKVIEKIKKQNREINILFILIFNNMYKATVSYPYGGGKRIRTIHYASTKFFAWLKAKWSTCFKNDDFFDIKVDVE